MTITLDSQEISSLNLKTNAAIGKIEDMFNANNRQLAEMNVNQSEMFNHLQELLSYRWIAQGVEANPTPIIPYELKRMTLDVYKDELQELLSDTEMLYDAYTEIVDADIKTSSELQKDYEFIVKMNRRVDRLAILIEVLEEDLINELEA